MHQVTTHSPSVDLLGTGLKKAIGVANEKVTGFKIEIGVEEEVTNEDLIPYWVDQDYSYDPSNPRKPNMRELVEALSGREIEDLYADPNSSWRTFSKQASDILYGVLGGTQDTRDWDRIMSSKDILASANDQTARLHEPYIDIQSQYETVELTDGSFTKVLTAQFPVLKNKYNDVLSTNLNSGSHYTVEELDRFGGKDIMFNKSILQKIEIPNFDFDNLQVIQNYLEDTPS